MTLPGVFPIHDDESVVIHASKLNKIRSFFFFLFISEGRVSEKKMCTKKSENQC